MKNLKIQRTSFMEVGEIYFFTATIYQWRKLLQTNRYKDVIINSLSYLSYINKIDVFAFVIMPNHVHIIWRTNTLNGKEAAHSSFLKFTSHEFKKLLINQDSKYLEKYYVQKTNKNYEFWQRDSMAIQLYTRDVAFQKMDYLHSNPVAEHWQLVKDPCDYYYSTASFYEQGISRFSFIKDLRLEF